MRFIQTGKCIAFKGPEATGNDSASLAIIEGIVPSKRGGGLMSTPEKDFLDEIENMPIIDLSVIMEAIHSSRTEAKHKPVIAEAISESFRDNAV